MLCSQSRGACSPSLASRIRISIPSTHMITTISSLIYPALAPNHLLGMPFVLTGYIRDKKEVTFFFGCNAVFIGLDCWQL